MKHQVINLREKKKGEQNTHYVWIEKDEKGVKDGGNAL
jgi:hypothetical protein